MNSSQTIRSLVAARARLLAFAVMLFGLGFFCGSAAAQGGPGGRHGGMRVLPRGGGRAFMPGPTISAAPRIGLQLGLGGRWWDDGKVGKRLTLRDDQRRHMDDIFEANKPTLVTLYTNLQREETRLASLPPGDMQDESKVFAAIDRVAAARTELEKASAHYLVQIRQQMDPAQLDQLDREIASSR
jgi:Spy/CpxP family protein refolding chaperone